MQERVELIEELAARAWPAVEVRPLDGWRLRHSRAGARRSNSVLPNGSGALPLQEKLRRVEEFYAPTGRPARYQISPAARPPDLDILLGERGYRVECPTLVQIASVAEVRERLGEALGDVVISDRPDEEWLETYRVAEEFGDGEVEVRKEVLQLIPAPTRYALARQEGRPVAVGLGVAERGWLGVFCMATVPAFRRRGHAKAVLAALTNWGLAHEAAGAYLQVTEENVPARSLYARLGFATLYGYHYRSKSLSQPEDLKPS